MSHSEPPAVTTIPYHYPTNCFLADGTQTRQTHVRRSRLSIKNILGAESVKG